MKINVKKLPFTPDLTGIKMQRTSDLMASSRLWMGFCLRIQRKVTHVFLYLLSVRSHLWSPGSNPGLSFICGLSLLLFFCGYRFLHPVCHVRFVVTRDISLGYRTCEVLSRAGFSLIAVWLYNGLNSKQFYDVLCAF